MFFKRFRFKDYVTIGNTKGSVKYYLKSKNPVFKEQLWFKQCLSNKTLIKKLKHIRFVILDIDGALTNGYIYLSENLDGHQDSLKKMKGFSTQDGFAINQAIKHNILQFAFLSGRNDTTTRKRAQVLGIPKELCFTGIDHNKPEKVLLAQKKLNISSKETLHFGDDFLDLEIKPHVEIFASPQNAPFYIQHAAHLVVPKDGANSSFRLLLDLILYIQGNHFAQSFIKKALT
jgi:3-deoxy-D-manno-octulosonate 8-phosphate phosphatase (KDO 8-P phosphatase)